MCSALKTTPQGVKYLTYGSEDSALCLVCVHGWACQATDYTYLLDELSRQDLQFRAIAISLPGHGGSSTEHYPDGSMDSMADAVLGLIDHLSLDNVVLIGHSMGMRISLETWRKSQALGKPKIKGLVFLDGSNYKLRKSLFAFDSGDPRSQGLSPEQKIAGMQHAFQRMFSDKTPMDFQTSTLEHVRTRNLQYSDAMRKSFTAFDFNELDQALEELGRSQVPLLNLQATDVDEENQRVPLKPGEPSLWMRIVQEKVPQAEQSVIEDSLHFPHVDQPEEVAKKVRIFLESLQNPR